MNGGNVLLNGGLLSFPNTIVGLTPNSTTWIFINIGTGTIQTNSTNFPASSFPIAIATTTNTGVQILLDSRPDYVITGASTGINGRFILNFGTLLTTGNFSLTGWGSGATMSSLAGRDSAHSFTITAGTGATSGAQVQLTFADGSWGTPPLVFTGLTKGTGMLLTTSYTSTATTYTITFNGLPLAGLTYSASVLVAGIS